MRSALRLAKTQEALKAKADQPVERRLPITPEQASLCANFIREIVRLNEQFNATCAGILSGHGVTGAQQVRLEGTPEKPILRFLDCTGVPGVK